MKDTLFIQSREELRKEFARIIGIRHCIAFSAVIREDLVIVATLNEKNELWREREANEPRRETDGKGLVAEEEDLLDRFLFQVFQRVTFVPALREDIETDLSA